MGSGISWDSAGETVPGFPYVAALNAASQWHDSHVLLRGGSAPLILSGKVAID